MNQKLIFTALFYAAAATTSAYSAYAKATLAAAIPADIAKDGVATGMSSGFPSRALADKDAVDRCLGYRGVGEKVLSLCKVVATFDGQCVAIAIDPAAGTPGFGWGIGDGIPEAEEKALAACRDSSPADRKSFCRVEERKCDTTG